MINIILCGGNGTRLWPISRSLYPKQFVKIFNKKSLFELTYERNLKICNEAFVVSNEQQYFLVLDQLENIGTNTNVKCLLEPIAKNTAPAIAIACFMLDKNDIVLVTPSDHLIKNEQKYLEVVAKAKVLAQQNYLVTFGITPSCINTGFGYIEANGENVVKFHEKPDEKTAAMYVESGNFYWNSGMFLFRVETLLDELKLYSPEIYASCKKVAKNIKQNAPLRIKLDDMMQIPENSIDYAVMEKSKKVKVVPADIEWSDVGSFDALGKEMAKDEKQNTIDKNHININSKNNIIISKSRKIATVDIDDLIIVDTSDALLVSKKGSSQKVKNVVAKLKEAQSELCDTHLTGYRPWGSYTVLEVADGYKIKRIEVKPGKRLSLQKHFHRSEHWIVVSGTATVTVGDETRLVRPNESTYIKMGEIHRLANDGKIPVILIEAQVGEYTGEDDIVRIEDDFNR